MRTLDQRLTDAHPWLSTEKAHWLLQHRIECFRDELELEGEDLVHALSKAASIYKNMPEDDFRNTIARFEEHHL